MSKISFFTHYNRPPAQDTVLDYETCNVSQADIDVSSLAYQLDRYGMEGLQARMEAMRDKFGYADTTKFGNFADLQNRVRKGVEYFEALPSEVRAKFGHRPELFYEYLENNKDEAIKAGYIKADIKVDDDVVNNTLDNNIGQELIKDDNTIQPVPQIPVVDDSVKS